MTSSFTLTLSSFAFLFKQEKIQLFMKPAVKSYWTDDLPARWIIDTREGYWLIDGFVTSFCWLSYGLSHWTASTFEKRGTKIQYILLVVSLFCDRLSRVWKDQNKDFISSLIRYCVYKCLQRTPWRGLPPPLRRKGIEPSWRHQWRQVLHGIYGCHGHVTGCVLSLRVL